MKKLILALSLVISSVSFASECSPEAINVAKMNLDQVAKSYGFDNSEISQDSADNVIEIIIAKNGEELSVHTVYGYIYKAGYTVKVTLDSLCAIRNVSIQDDSSL